LLFVLSYVLFVRKYVLPPGDNPISVNKYIISYIHDEMNKHTELLTDSDTTSFSNCTLHSAKLLHEQNVARCSYMFDVTDVSAVGFIHSLRGSGIAHDNETPLLLILHSRHSHGNHC
jgi:hypothetical protein